jgi:hypothetical protein
MVDHGVLSNSKLTNREAQSFKFCTKEDKNRNQKIFLKILKNG